MHPTKQYFAVAEKGVYPNIYIYEYPSLRLKRILRKGTERSYSNICFSLSGDKLASVCVLYDISVYRYRLVVAQITRSACGIG